MTRLRGSVHNQIGRYRLHAVRNPLSAPEIQLMMAKVPIGRQQPVLIPTRVACGAKEFRPLVIINPMYFPPILSEVRNDFRTNQSRRPGNEKFVHVVGL